MTHIPVLQKQVIEYLDPKPKENFIDCTFGQGGHTKAILKKGGRVLAIEADSQLCQRKINRLTLVNDSYSNLEEIVKKYNFRKVNGILLDLGISSWHLEESGRGFSFLRNEPLDMRYDSKNQLTAEKIVNYWSGADLERILKEYGEEKYAQRIAKKIIEERRKSPLKQTFQLVEIIKEAVLREYSGQRIHCSTRTFQALRMAVNRELENIEKVLPQALKVLSPQGRLVVISFHSLEDRIVKNFFKNRRLKVLTKKPIKADQEEIKINPRSRSAKLRAVKKI